MSDTLTITVNKQEVLLKDTFGSSADDLLAGIGVDPSQHNLYRVGDLPPGADVSEEDRCGEPLVVDDGDGFVMIPKYADDGG